MFLCTLVANKLSDPACWLACGLCVPPPKEKPTDCPPVFWLRKGLLLAGADVNDWDGCCWAGAGDMEKGPRVFVNGFELGAMLWFCGAPPG